MTTDEALRKSMEAAVAGVITGALQPEQRDAILTKAVTDYLADWSFKQAMRTILEDRVMAIAKKHVDVGVYDERILEAMRTAMDSVVTEVGPAAKRALVAAFFGREGKEHYDRYPGFILKELDKK